MIKQAPELLRDALPLYAVADGHKTRTMIDAVRAALPDVWNSGQEWFDAMTALSEATDKTLLNGFQTWETQEGRTIEECREAFQRAIPIAEEILRKRRDAELDYYCYC